MLLSYNCTVAKKIIEYVMFLETNSQTVGKQCALSSESFIFLSLKLVYFGKGQFGWARATYVIRPSFFFVSSTIFFNSNIGVFFFYRKLHKFSNDSLDQINQNVSVRESN